MALIKCSKCGKEISDRATTICPSCGCPVRQIPPPLLKRPMPPPIMPAPKQKRHYVKIIKYLFLGIWTLWFIMGIAGNYTHYKADDWIFIILFSIAPYLILWYLAHQKARKGKRAHQNIIKETAAVENPMGSAFSNPIPQPINHTTIHPIPKQTNAKSESAVEKLETAQNMLDESLKQLNEAISSGNILKATVQQSNVSSAAPISGISYVDDGKTISRADGKEITDEEIPHLVQIGCEKALQAEKDSPNPKYHRTASEKNLAFSFEMKYGNEVCVLTDEFESLYRDAHETPDLDKRITILEDAIKAFKKARHFCYSKGKGGTIYFQDMWEHLHNSQYQCFSYLDGIQNSLEDTIYLKDTVIPEIINAIAQNDYIIQKSIYGLLPHIDKSLIQSVIKNLEVEGIISRIKKGNSYELHILDNVNINISEKRGITYGISSKKNLHDR